MSQDLTSPHPLFPHPSGASSPRPAQATAGHALRGAGVGQTGVRNETEPRQEVTRVYYLTAAAWRAQAHADRARPAARPAPDPRPPPTGQRQPGADNADNAAPPTPAAGRARGGPAAPSTRRGSLLAKDSTGRDLQPPCGTGWGH